MFTGNTVKLSDFDKRFGLKVHQDGNFSYVGKLPTKLSRRLVPCATLAQAMAALGDENIAGLVVPPEIEPTIRTHKALASALNPMRAVQRIHTELSNRDGFFWSSFESLIDPTATIHPTAFVENHDVVIGSGTIIGPFSYVGKRSLIGENCRIGSHCTIGWESFELDANKDEPDVLAHVGGVKIEDHVEMLSHCTVARCAFGGFTQIDRYAKFDSHILVAHDAHIGERVRIAAGVTICGRVEVGNQAYLAPGSVISNGVQLGELCEVSIGAVVARNVAPGQKVSGNFAMPHTRWMKMMANAAR